MTSSRHARVLTPLGDELLLRAFSAQEALSAPFRYELDLLSTDESVDFNALLGQPMTVELELPTGGVRQFSGLVTEFSMRGASERYVSYRAELRPWLSLLGYTTNCRIFQNLSVPEVLKQVFKGHGFDDVEFSLSDEYRTWEYLVQYRESDLNFVSRILEQEGIYYFFRHRKRRHVLVVADSYGAHEVTSGYEALPFYPPSSALVEVEHVHSWQTTRRIRPGAYAATDFDFLRPAARLLTEREAPESHARAEYQVYDYPGEFKAHDEAQKEVRVRLEEQQASAEVAEARTNARGVAAGALFSLKNHARADQNREYLVLETAISIQVDGYESGASETSTSFSCRFSAMESARPYRAPRATRKPVVEGPQTAIVVGKEGSEIWTDEYARVKVQFHWDRQGQSNEESSCWVRVSQIWAGSGFGGIHIPRLGQEVIVDFLEGDPDRPIVTGRVYNFDQMPPYKLPDNQTQSGIQSRSTKGGSPSNFNEIRFEDKKGQEELFVQAEKDLTAVVKNDEVRTVGHDQGIEIGHDRQTTVKHNETVTVLGSRVETVAESESIDIGGSRTETVGTVEQITIGAARTTTVGAADALTVRGVQSVTVGAARSITVAGTEVIAVGGSRSIDVAKNASMSIAGKRSVQVGKDDELLVEGKRVQNVNKTDALHVKEKVEIVSDKEIVLKAGDATITLSKNGNVTIKGKNITLEGSGKINVKASSDVILKGSKVLGN